MESMDTFNRGRVPDADKIEAFRHRPGVWLTFAGSAFLMLYADRLRSLSLKPSWVTALAIIAEQPGMTQSALGRLLRINRASSMALAITLEDSGLVSREALAGRKQTSLRLTALGGRRLVEACGIEETLRDTVFKELSNAEVASFVEILRRVTAFANRADTD